MSTSTTPVTVDGLKVTQDNVQRAYIAYYGRPGEPDGVNFWTTAGTPQTSMASILGDFAKSTEFTALYGTTTNAQFVDAVYRNVFGRSADAAGLNFYTNALTSNITTKARVVFEIVNGAQGADKTIIDNKASFATLFTNELAKTPAAFINYQSPFTEAKTTLATINASTKVSDLSVLVGTTIEDVVKNQPVGPNQPFVLTIGVDEGTKFAGGANNDLFTGSDTTLTALDSLAGGAGNDTLQITATGAFTFPSSASLNSVETLTIRGGDAVTADTSISTITGLTKVVVSQSAKAAALTAAKTTDVTISGAADAITIDGGKDIVVTDATADAVIKVGDKTVSAGSVTITDSNQGKGDIAVYGGTAVTVTASKVSSGAVLIGDAAVATDLPSGAIVVTSTGGAYAAKTANPLGKITVNGGSTVAITQTASSDTAAAAKDGLAADTTHSTFSITGGAATTSVSVTQSAAATKTNAVTAVTGVKQIDTVTFVAMAAAETITVGGLTFTASKALTAAEAAAAFANLAASATHGSASVASGTYSGTFGAYSTGAVTTASGVSTVSATASTAAATAAVITVSDTAAAGNVSATQGTGTAAVTGVTGVMGVVNGGVTIADGTGAAADTLATVSLTSYGTASITSDALSSLSLAKSAAATTIVNGVSKTLGLSLDTVTGTIAAPTYTTLNISASGGDSTSNITAAAVETLTVKGSKAVNLTGSTLSALKTVTVSETAGLTINASGSTVTSVDTSATTGKVTATVDGSKATYTGGAGVDAVTLSSSTVSKAISLGDGADSLTLASGTTSLTSAIDGGAGTTDTLIMAASDAITASATATFETKVDGFERLQIGAVAAGGSGTVNLANMDDVSYVITLGGAGNFAGTAEVATFKFSSIQNGQSITISDGTKTQTVTANDDTFTGAKIAAAFNTGFTAGTLDDLYTALVSTDTLTLTAIAVGNATNLASTTAVATAASVPTAVKTEGAAAVTGVKEVFTATFSGFATGMDTIKFDGETATLADKDNSNLIATAVTAAVNNTAGSWDAKNNFDGTVTFTAGTAGAVIDVVAADLVVTDTGSNGRPTVSVTTTTQGVTAVTAVTESNVVTFNTLSQGQTVTVGGLGFTAFKNLTAIQVADAFDNLANAATTGPGTANGTYSGALTGWSTDNSTGNNTATFTSSTANKDVTDLSISVSNATAPTVVTPTITDGSAVAAAGALTLSSVANGATVSLSSSGTWASTTSTTLTMLDATGTSDSINLIANVNASDIDFGTVAVAGVETVNITATDSTPVTTAGVATISKATLVVTNTSAKSVVVTGEANLTLTATGASLASVSADAATGKFVFSSAVNSAVVTGGSAADTLTASGNNASLSGGSGSDTLIATGDLAVLTGGAGNDTFNISDPTSNVNTYATIADLAAGDKIQFSTGAKMFISTAFTLGSGTAVFQDYANAAIGGLKQGEVGYFQFGGDTYVVEDRSNNATAFINGTDVIVKLAGLVNLSDDVFSSSANTLMIV